MPAEVPNDNNSTFDRAAFPEEVACQVLPALDDNLNEVEITDWDQNRLVLGVSRDAVRRITMPRISRNVPVPKEVKEGLEAGIGLGTVACRILNRHEDLVAVEVPTTSGYFTVTVPFNQLARRVVPNF